VTDNEPSTAVVWWEVGSPLPSVERPTLARADIAKFAAAVGDFNPIHIDEPFAIGAGLPSVIAHGPLTLAIVAQALGKAFGAENVRGVSAQFRAPAVPGDDLRVDGTVSEIVERGGERRVICDLRVVRQDGTTVATGSGEAVIGDG
jgi:acyl dehydratase